MAAVFSFDMLDLFCSEDFLKTEGCFILIGQDQLLLRDAPVDGQCFIQWVYAALGFFVVIVIAFVEEGGLLAQHDKSVQEATRYEQLQVVLGREFYGYILAVGVGSGTDVDGDIDNGSLQDAYEFGLCMFAGLCVQSAQYATARIGLVVLYELGLRAGQLVKGARVEAFEKIAPAVTVFIGLQYKAAFEFGFCCSHTIPDIVCRNISGNRPRSRSPATPGSPGTSRW